MCIRDRVPSFRLVGLSYGRFVEVSSHAAHGTDHRARELVATAQACSDALTNLTVRRLPSRLRPSLVAPGNACLDVREPHRGPCLNSFQPLASRPSAG